MTQGQYPTINNGIGNLTPDLWRRLMTMLQKFEQKDRDERRSKSDSKDTKPMLAKITGSSGSANKYTYSWTEVRLTEVSGQFEDFPNARTGTGAVNTCELSNTATHVGSGVDVASDSYPEGYSMMPIGKCGDDTLIDLVVILHAVFDSGANKRYVFSMTNSHDGSCL